MRGREWNDRQISHYSYPKYDSESIVPSMIEHSRFSSRDWLFVSPYELPVYFTTTHPKSYPFET